MERSKEVNGDLLKLPELPNNVSKATKQAIRRVRDLIKVNKEVCGCAQTLLDGYQLQQWAVHALKQLKLDKKTEEMVLLYIKLKSLRPFKEEPLRNQLRDVTLPFMSDRILEHVKKQTQSPKED